MILRARQHTLEFPCRALVMGSVQLAVEPSVASASEAHSRALAAAREVANAGADIIAVEMGGFPAVLDEAQQNLAFHIGSNFVKGWKQNACPQLLALHLPSLAVASGVIPLGGDFLSTFHSPDSLEFAGCAALCAEHGAGLIVNYKVPSVCEATAAGNGFDVVSDAFDAFERSLQCANLAGLSEASIVLGVRLAWGDDSSTAHSVRVCAHMKRFQKFGRPLLLSDLPANGDRSEGQTAGTVARVVYGRAAGVSIFHGDHVGAIAAAVRTIGAVLE